MTVTGTTGDHARLDHRRGAPVVRSLGHALVYALMGVAVAATFGLLVLNVLR